MKLPHLDVAAVNKLVRETLAAMRPPVSSGRTIGVNHARPSCPKAKR